MGRKRKVRKVQTRRAKQVQGQCGVPMTASAKQIQYVTTVYSTLYSTVNLSPPSATAIPAVTISHLPSML